MALHRQGLDRYEGAIHRGRRKAAAQYQEQLSGHDTQAAQACSDGAAAAQTVIFGNAPVAWDVPKDHPCAVATNSGSCKPGKTLHVQAAGIFGLWVSPVHFAAVCAPNGGSFVGSHAAPDAVPPAAPDAAPCVLSSDPVIFSITPPAAATVCAAATPRAAGSTTTTSKPSQSPSTTATATGPGTGIWPAQLPVRAEPDTQPGASEEEAIGTDVFFGTFRPCRR